ncbi:MAG TPA: NUDIX domain-containing protein [Pyrinomonadaceae bacterium]|nr:NUDIX domain-containing protein [Pyrinomonadaceae bacterium]
MLKKIAGTIWRKMPSSARMKIVRLTQKQFTVSVAAIVLNESDEILLLDHVLRPGSGWGIPGGFLARAEQPVDALCRELYEETGIKLDDIKLLNVRTISRHVEILFRARASGTPEVKSREINSLGWFNVDKMPENMNRSQKAMIRNYLNNKLEG